MNPATNQHLDTAITFVAQARRVERLLARHHATPLGHCAGCRPCTPWPCWTVDLAHAAYRRRTTRTTTPQGVR